MSAPPTPSSHRNTSVLHIVSAHRKFHCNARNFLTTEKEREDCGSCGELWKETCVEVWDEDYCAGDGELFDEVDSSGCSAAASSAHHAPLLHSARVSMRASTRCFAGSAVCAALLQGKGHQALTLLPPLSHHQLIYD